MTTQTAVQKVEPQQVAQAEQPQGEITAFISMIERAARDPQVDVDKMERLLAMQEKVIERQAKAAYTAAMVAMKPKLPVIDRKGKIEIRAKDSTGQRTGALQQSTAYARWEDIDEAITPILHEHGFSLTHRSSTAPDGKIIVTAVCEHIAGHREENSTPPLPHDSTGSKNPTQAVVSTLSYGKRVASVLLLNIRTKGEDDDGAAAGAGPRLSPEECENIRDMLKAKGADEGPFLKWARAEKIEDIPAAYYDSCVDAIKQYKAKAKANG